MRGVEGSTVMPEESPVGASTANAVVERSVLEMQSNTSKALVPFGELVMYMPMEKPKDKGEVWNRVGIMVGLVDRSDEVAIGTTERVVKARIVHRMLAGQ